MYGLMHHLVCFLATSSCASIVMFFVHTWLAASLQPDATSLACKSIEHGGEGGGEGGQQSNLKGL
jgi:hypothetical protein